MIRKFKSEFDTTSKFRLSHIYIQFKNLNKKCYNYYEVELKHYFQVQTPSYKFEGGKINFEQWFGFGWAGGGGRPEPWRCYLFNST